MKKLRRAIILWCAVGITIVNVFLLLCRDQEWCDSVFEYASSTQIARLDWSNICSQKKVVEALSYNDGNLTTSATLSTAENPQFKTPLYHFPRPTNEFQLLILVTSSATALGAERRNGIRRTWHSKWHNVTPALPVWGTFFLLGQTNDTNVMGQLYGEADEHKDLIIGDFVDHFYNLSIKVMVGFEWASQFASSSSYILKLDDDVFPILPNVFAFLFDKETPRNGLYAGNVQFDAVPLRFGKYSVSREEYARRYYPRYVSGGGILLSMDVVTAMVSAHNMSDYFKIDDVYYGMLAQRLNIDPYPDQKNFVLEDAKRNSCTVKQSAVVQHGFGEVTCLETAYKQTARKQVPLLLKLHMRTNHNANERRKTSP